MLIYCRYSHVLLKPTTLQTSYCTVCEINFHLQGLSKQTPVVITFLQNVQQMLNVMLLITVVVGGCTLPSGDIMKLCLARWHTNKIVCAFK